MRGKERVFAVFLCTVLRWTGKEASAEQWAPGPHRIPEVILDKILNIYAPTSQAVENENCRQDSVSYKQAVKNNQEWALRMLDASSKVPSGLVMGNLVQLGNYDECISVEGVVTSSGRFSGQNCMVNLDEGASKLVNATISEMVSVPSIRWSFCIPSSCTPLDLELHLRSVLQAKIGDMRLTVGDRACRSREQISELTPGGWFAIVLCAIVAVIVVLSTAYDVVMRDSESRCALKASFSIYSNGRKLLNSPVETDTLQVIHGMRAVSIMWVLLGQTFYMHSHVPAINRNTMQPDNHQFHVPLLKAKYDWDHLLIRNSELAPDTFLLFSGMLVCYGFLRDMETRSSFNAPFYYLHRYIRLTPAYSVMILFMATLFRLVDDGPLWGEYTISCQNCQTNWWANLLYLNNYINVDALCIGPSWFLAVNMQLFWISPLILYPLWRWPKVGKILLGVLIGVGVLTSFLVAFLNEIPVNDYGRDAVLMRDIPTHMRFTPWLIGMGLGYALHVTKGKTPAHSMITVNCCFVLGAILQLSSSLLLPLFQTPGHEYERWTESLFICLNKPAWAIGVAWIVYACEKGYAVPINALLSWKLFRVLGRLAYGVYLVHMSVLLWLFGTVRAPMYLHDRTIMINFSAILLISFGGAVILFLIFEAPPILIENILLKKYSSKQDSGPQTHFKETLFGELEKDTSNSAVERDAPSKARENEGFVS